jgi:hypothetical protein
MGVFSTTAAYNYQPSSTAIAQDPLYTYYTCQSGIDVSIPNWTIRIINTLTSSIGIIGWSFFSANAQYSSPSHSACYPGLISSPVNTTRSTNGYLGGYGMHGWIKSFSSQSTFTDSFTLTGAGTGNAPWSANGQMYGGSAGALTAYTSYIVRDKTQWITGSYLGIQYGSWGNQPYVNTCAAYSCSFAATNITKYTACSDGSAVTSSAINNACARTYQFSGAGGSPGKLLITNYYTGSCGTY